MWLIGKEFSCNAGAARDVDSIPGSGRFPGGGHDKPPVFLPGESHGQRSLVGYGLEGCKESDTFLQSGCCRLVSVVLCVFSSCLYIKLVVCA